MSLSTRLFVGNLPENFKENDLREAFSNYGVITNLDIKSKPGTESEKKTFAFVNLSASNYNVETCIKHFSNEDFCGQRLYVTRARESFLERLQREREQAQLGNAAKVVNEDVVKQNPFEDKHKFKEDDTYEISKIKNRKSFTEQDSYNGYKQNHNERYSNKRKFNDESFETSKPKNKKSFNDQETYHREDSQFENEFETRKSKNKNSFNKQDAMYNGQKNDNNIVNFNPKDDKKHDADKKRMESIKRKRQEFNEKKNIIKTGLISIDTQRNKKVIFSDAEDNETESVVFNKAFDKDKTKGKVNLFDNDDSEDETDFNIKKQFEGKQGQKVLELQSRFKADKRFTMDERFVEDQSDEDKDEGVDLEQADEKTKQLDILQNVLGVQIKTHSYNTSDVKNKTKAKPGMLRFDPSQPDHAKFLAPVEAKPELKKGKKKKNKEPQEEIVEENQPAVEKVEVSKEQFYKISDTLKEAITQPKEFSLRSLFASNDNNVEEETTDQNADFIPLDNKKDKKIRNPLDPGEKNPFVYDSSDSENEEEVQETDKTEFSNAEPKIVWREKLFFTENDSRLKDGLLFFSKRSTTEVPKDRRELKSLMKKRIYNKERKNHMFQKKIGGRKKTMKKSFKKKR